MPRFERHALALGISGLALFASTSAAETPHISAQEQMQQSFQQLAITSFKPAPIDGLYQAFIGDKIVYYSPDPELLFFGQIYDVSGKNLTADALQQALHSALGSIDTASALAIGREDAPTVIEFSNPDCGYCQALERFWASKEAEGYTFRRLIFFVAPPNFPTAAKKVEHILCSPDPAAEMKAVYGGAVPQTLLSCEMGKERLRAHGQTAGDAGVSGTPTLIVDGRVISGFRTADIQAFLDEHKEKDYAQSN
ncbi:MAG: DsbC family protein [Pseudomonadota bacterium]